MFDGGFSVFIATGGGKRCIRVEGAPPVEVNAQFYHGTVNGPAYCRNRGVQAAGNFVAAQPVNKFEL